MEWFAEWCDPETTNNTLNALLVVFGAFGLIGYFEYDRRKNESRK